GAGAAAFVLAPEGGAAALTTRVSRTWPVLDRYRGDGEAVTRDLYDPRLFREEVFLPLVGAVAREAGPATEVRAWSLPGPGGRLDRARRRSAGDLRRRPAGPRPAGGVGRPRPDGRAAGRSRLRAGQPRAPGPDRSAVRRVRHGQRPAVGAPRLHLLRHRQVRA